MDAELRIRQIMRNTERESSSRGVLGSQKNICQPAVMALSELCKAKCKKVTMQNGWQQVANTFSTSRGASGLEKPAANIKAPASLASL